MSDVSPQPSHLSRKFLSLALLAIFTAGIAVYANSLHGELLWDDEVLVQNNPYIKDWAHVPKILTSNLGTMAKQGGGFYRPVQILSYLVDYSFWRLNVVGYHTINMAWHVLAAVVLFFLIQQLFKNPKLSLLTSLLFVVHPIHTEAVAYISGRADSLAAAFMLVAFLLYLKQDGKSRFWLQALMVVSYVLALFSRENSLILPFLITFYHYVYKKPLLKKPVFLLWGTLAAYAFWRIAVIGLAQIAEGATPTFAQRLPGVFVALAGYYRLLLFPFNLHMEYGGILFPYSEPQALVGLVMFVGTCLYVSIKRKTDPFLVFAVGWFFFSLFPSSNVLFAINAYMAEHWLYIPSIGFFLLLARFLLRLQEQKPFKVFALVLMVGLLVFYAVLTIRQNRVWRSGINLYQAMIRYAPESSRLYNNLAKAYHDAGRDSELIELLKSAIKFQPDNALALNNLANTYKSMGKYEEARQSYEQAIKIDPQHAGLYFNLSMLYSDIYGNTEEAIRLLNKSIELGPQFAKPYNKLGLIYLQQGHKEKAIALLEQARKYNPDDPEIYHSLGFMYVQSSDPEKAKIMYQKAIDANANYVEAYHDLAIIYATEQNYPMAIRYCDQAVARGYVDEQLLETLKPYR